MSINRYSAVLNVMGLICFEAFAVAALHAMGDSPYIGIDWTDVSGSLATAPADRIVVSLVWLAATVLAWWALASTVLCVLVRVKGLRFGARFVHRLAFPGVRRMVDRALATTLVTTALFSPASAALADDRPSVPLLRQAPAVEYEPSPAGSESSDEAQPPVGPQRKAPPVVGRDEKKPSESRSESKPDRGEEAEPDKGDKRDDRSPEEQWKQRDDVAEAEEAGRAMNTGEAEDAGGPPQVGPRPDRANQPDSPGERQRGFVVAREMRDRAELAADQEEEAGDAGAEAAERAEKERGQKDRDEQRVSRKGRRSSGPQAGERYTVRTGDHLWKIAAEVVGTDDRRAVASYWARLVREAAPRLRSDDPNLIYPGETIDLPPLAERTGGQK